MEILQIIVSLLLISLIVLQSKGTGLGSAWGGIGGNYHSKRGMEKTFFSLTIILSIAFVLLSLLLAL